MWVSTMIFSIISDWCISRKFIGITNSRKLYTTLSFTVPGIFLVAASYSGCDRVIAVTLFTLAMAFMGAYYSGMKVNALDLSPNFAGTLMGITNGISALTGIAAVNPRCLSFDIYDIFPLSFRSLTWSACSRQTKHLLNGAWCSSFLAASWWSLTWCTKSLLQVIHNTGTYPWRSPSRPDQWRKRTRKSSHKPIQHFCT